MLLGYSKLQVEQLYREVPVGQPRDDFIQCRGQRK